MSKDFIQMTIDPSELNKMNRWLETCEKESTNKFWQIINATAKRIERRAKMFAPVGKTKGKGSGFLRSKIHTGGSKAEMSAFVVVDSVNYAPYVEFGTGTKVVAPDDVKDYAMTFKGKGIRKVNNRAQPYLFPAARISIKEMMIALQKLMG